MSYELKIEPKAGYLHFTVTGRNTRDNVMRYMQEVFEECATRRCFRMLIEERLEGPRLGTMDVYTMVSSGAKRYHGLLEAMAFVDVNADAGVMRFAEEVAVNRGIPVRVFRAVEGAAQWLQQHSQPAANSAQAPLPKPPV